MTCQICGGEIKGRPYLWDEDSRLPEQRGQYKNDAQPSVAVLQTNNDLRRALERCAVQIDQWDSDYGPGPVNPDLVPSRAATLISVIRHVVSALEFKAKGSEPALQVWR